MNSWTYVITYSGKLQGARRSRMVVLFASLAKTINYNRRLQLGPRPGEAQRAVAIQMLFGNHIATVAKMLKKQTQD